MSLNGISWNGGTPKWTVYDGKSHWNGWFRGTPIYGNSQMVPEALELWVTQGMDPRSSRTSVQSTLQKAGRCRVQMSTVPSVLPLVRRQASLFEGSLEVKLPTIWTDGKAEVGRVTEEKRRERVRRKSQEKESGERVRRKSQEKESGERVTKKSQEKESGERVRRKSHKKESQKRVTKKSQEKESGERVRRKSQEKESGERVRRKSQEKES